MALRQGSSHTHLRLSSSKEPKHGPLVSLLVPFFEDEKQIERGAAGWMGSPLDDKMMLTTDDPKLFPPRAMASWSPS